MSKIYGRRHDMESLSREIITCNPQIDFNLQQQPISWQNVLGVEKDISLKLSEKMASKLANTPISIKRNPFRRYPKMNSGNNYDQIASFTFPSLDARYEYRGAYANFLGRLLYRYKEYNDEYHHLIPFLFEYFSYQDTSTEEFEKIKILEQQKLGLTFLRFLNEIDHKEHDMDDCEAVILSAMQYFSLFDAALQLTDIFEKDESKVLKIVDDILTQKKKTFEVLEDEGISTYGYKRLRKTIDKYRTI